MHYVNMEIKFSTRTINHMLYILYILYALYTSNIGTAHVGGVSQYLYVTHSDSVSRRKK
jgi:hypothetical protein